MDLSGQNLGVYHLESVIDHGPRATVYRARQVQVGRAVALKLYHESVDAERVHRAFEATEQLTDAHVLPVYHFDTYRGQALLAMRHMPVGSLARRRGALLQKDVAHILPQIAQALDHAHAHAVLHLNLKPANILFDHPGNAFVSDFGLPAEIDSPYTAPELARGGRSDARADVYGLGALLYLMLTGRAPLARRASGASAENQRLVELPAPRSIRAEIAVAVEAVVMRALSIDPDARYATAGELSAAYLDAAGHEEPESRRAPVTALPLRRMVLGALGILAVGVIAWGVASSAPGLAPVEPTPSTSVTLPVDTATYTPTATLPSPSATHTSPSPTHTPAPRATTATSSAALSPTPSIAAAPIVETLTAASSTPARFTPAPIIATPTPAANATFTVISLALKSPPVRLDVGDRLELFFDAVLAPAQGGPYGQLFAYLPDIDALVTTRIGAQISSGAQVLRLVIGVDCARVPQPVTTDHILLEIRETDRSAALYRTSIPYVQIWCR